MNNKSIWETFNIKVKSSNIKNELTTDILIIGGGITGLSVAYFLKDSKEKIVLIDKGNIGSGITSKTTAKVSYLQGDIYNALTNKFNENTAKLYLDSQKDAIKLMIDIINKNKIECDLKKTDSYLFTMKEDNIDKIIKEKELLEKWNINVLDVVDKKIAKGIKVSDTYIIHPLKYLNGLVKEINKKVDIYENIMAVKLTLENNNYKVETNKGIIYAKKVVVACHYPFFIIPNLIPLKTYIKREYVNVGKVDKEKDYTAINIDDNLLSIRYYNDYLIYTSNKNRLTIKIDYKKKYREFKINRNRS